ncbi:MAG: response regulator [Candidatus Thorarchaeota archaeon]
MIRIFIVDDDQSLQRLYSLILKEAGCEITAIAIDGKDALDKYKSMKEKPDIVLMDHRMPIKSGLDAMDEILKINRNEKIVFASADITVKEKAMNHGAIAFLDKPFKMHKLLNTIKFISKELTIQSKH